MKKIDNACILLANSDNPRSLGERKQGSTELVFKLDQNYRMDYDVRDKVHLIFLIDVNDHKAFYRDFACR